MSITTAINDFKAALAEGVPLCTGIVPLDMNTSQLFYRKTTDGSSGFIDFSTSINDSQVEDLVQACQLATFGVQQKDVLDESFRKAWKMDAVNFASNFSPNNAGITRVIQASLLKDTNGSIRVELYKLNVYGPGSFFKSHVDTPRSDKMFGSLVVVLPTKHEGGTLFLRHQGREWTFDSAGIVSSQNLPHAAFAAFFGDVEHEVSVVKSGYRVTLTYNLYFEDDKATIPSVLTTDDTEVRVKRLLIRLLNDPKVLPDGGLIGFGLSHLYPIDPNATEMKELPKSLKGIDAMIMRICNSLSLDASIKALYEDSDVENQCGPRVALLLNEIPRGISGRYADQVEDGILSCFQNRHPSSCSLVYDVNKCSHHDQARAMLLLSPLPSNRQAPYVRYGNEATLNFIYYCFGLFIEVKAAKDRKTYHE